MVKLNFHKKITFLLNYSWHGLNEGFKNNTYFNNDNYLKKYPDVKDSNINPVKHYLLHGINENRNDIYDKNIKSFNLVKESKLFDYDYYSKETNMDFNSYDQALFHYLESGYKEGFEPNEEFLGNVYLKLYPEAAKDGWNPLVHYLKYGKYINETFPDKNLKEFSLVKYSGLFDYEFYEKESGLSFDSEFDAIIHYLGIGYKKGFNPSELFFGNVYLKLYPDIADDEWNPLVHYLKYGKSEGRVYCDKNLSGYYLVKYSGLFDFDYYQKESGLNFESEREAIIHYLQEGYKKGFNPSCKFDGNHYFDTYPDVDFFGFNPLVHYLKYGIHENRVGVKNLNYNNFNNLSDVNNALEKINKKVTIISVISDVKNGFNFVNNIFKTTKNFELILISSKNLDESFKSFEQHDHLKLISNFDVKMGLMNLLNDIFSNIKTDIILLNENVYPYDDWVKNLTISAYSNEKIGFVTPLSNFSTIDLVDFTEHNDIQKYIRNVSKKQFYESYPINDSCVYIKREVFDTVKFDNESNNSEYVYDFYENANLNGWKSIVDDSTYVNFKFNDNENDQEDLYDISTPYSTQNNPHVECIKSGIFNKIYDNLNKYLEEDIEKYSKKTILFVMHHSGGVEYTVNDIIESISEEYNCLLLKSWKDKLILYEYFQSSFIKIEEFKFYSNWDYRFIRNDLYKQIYFYVLFNYNIDFIQVDHLIYHTFDLIDIAKILDIPVSLSLHDFYFICQSYFLLDENNKYCEGYCDSNVKACSKNISWFDLPVDIVSWKEEWQRNVLELFNSVDKIVTATSFTKNLFLEHYSSLPEDKIILIEHGRDLIRYDNNHSVPNTFQSIKILIPGIIGPHKGSDFIKELKKIDKDDRLELHFMGAVDDELKELGINHKSYDRDEFSKNVYKIKPSFIGLFSVCAETYSHTLTESISAGIPVLASNLGALKLRIEKYGGGWLIDINEPETAYNKILEISQNKEEYVKVQRELKDIPIPTVEDMSNKYKELYNDLMEKSKTGGS